MARPRRSHEATSRRPSVPGPLPSLRGISSRLVSPPRTSKFKHTRPTRLSTTIPESLAVGGSQQGDGDWTDPRRLGLGDVSACDSACETAPVRWAAGGRFHSNAAKRPRLPLLMRTCNFFLRARPAGESGCPDGHGCDRTAARGSRCDALLTVSGWRYADATTAPGNKGGRTRLTSAVQMMHGGGASQSRENNMGRTVSRSR